jgi:hypothetical protein
MKTINLPGFTAEASLFTMHQHYQANDGSQAHQSRWRSTGIMP